MHNSKLGSSLPSVHVMTTSQAEAAYTPERESSLFPTASRLVGRPSLINAGLRPSWAVSLSLPTGTSKQMMQLQHACSFDCCAIGMAEHTRNRHGKVLIFKSSPQ